MGLLVIGKEGSRDISLLKLKYKKSKIRAFKTLIVDNKIDCQILIYISQFLLGEFSS